MRQSDHGIAFEDMLDGNHEESDPEENGSYMNDSDDEEDNAGDLESDESDCEEEHNEKDPRAGGVSVVLPQIQPDFAQISNDLFEAGSGKDVQIQKRARLYR